MVFKANVQQLIALIAGRVFHLRPNIAGLPAQMLLIRSDHSWLPFISA
jgi:hypothetical protein